MGRVMCVVLVHLLLNFAVTPFLHLLRLLLGAAPRSRPDVAQSPARPTHVAAHRRVAVLESAPRALLRDRCVLARRVWRVADVGLFACAAAEAPQRPCT